MAHADNALKIARLAHCFMQWVESDTGTDVNPGYVQIETPFGPKTLTIGIDRKTHHIRVTVMLPDGRNVSIVVWRTDSYRLQVSTLETLASAVVSLSMFAVEEV